MKSIVPVFILCLGVAIASPSLCQKKKAKVLFDAGVASLEQKDYSKALQSFQEAYEISPHWAVLAHIGTCYMKLDQPAKAIEAYAKYLKEGAEKIPPDEKKNAEEMIAEQKQKVGVLVLSVEKNGVEALVDGESIGESPFKEVILTPGTHEVAVVFGEGDVVKRNFELPAGQEFLLRVEQETHVSTSPPPVVSDTSPPKPESAPAETEAAPVLNPPPAENKIKGSPVPFGIALGLSIADLAMIGVSWGIFTHYSISADNFKNTLNDLQSGEDPNNEPFVDYTWEETCSQIEVSNNTEQYYCDTEYNRRNFVRRAHTWKIVGIATSSALVVPVTLAIVFGLNRQWFGGSKRKTASLSVMPLLSPDENGFMMNLDF